MTSTPLPASIISDENLAAVKGYLEHSGFVAALHWHLSGARHPTPLAFHSFDDYLHYLQESVQPGDAIDVWPFPEQSGDRIAGGKLPSPDGTIHQGGAY